MANFAPATSEHADDQFSITGGQLQIGRYHINYIEAGEGPLVLLLHGWPETARTWRRHLPQFAAAGYRAVAIDQLGYGGSSRPARIDAYRITELVRIAAEVVESLRHSTAAIVGHDWGAIVGWTAAWTRPDVFSSVVAAGVTFGGSGLLAYPTTPFGERKPSVVERELAGPDKVFYTEYFQLPGLAEQEFDPDPAGWLRDAYYSFSGSVPLPPGVTLPDLAELDRNPEAVMQIIRSPGGLCLSKGATFSDLFAPRPETLPSWLDASFLADAASDFERTGLTGGLNYYRCIDLSWELLSAYNDRQVEVPALYIGADRDPANLWAREAVGRMRERVPGAYDPVVMSNCGHWIHHERQAEFMQHTLGFLADVQR